MAGKIARLAALAALGLIFSYIESLLPLNFGVPGVKLGLANAAVLAALYLYGPREALCVSVVRVVLSAFLFSNLSALLYALAGAWMSLASMAALRRFSRLRLATVSACGGAAHNLGQILVAALVVRSTGVFAYLPALLAVGILTGLLIGIVVALILPRLQKIAK